MSLEQAATNEEPTMTDVTDKIAAAIDKLNSQLPLLARQQALPPELAAAHRAILRTLAEEGRAPSNDELAPLVGATAWQRPSNAWAATTWRWCSTPTRPNLPSTRPWPSVPPFSCRW